MSDTEYTSESLSEHVVAHGDGDTATPGAYKSPKAVPFSETYVLPILYLVVFLFFYGENIIPAPITQIYEHVICRRLHGGDLGGIVPVDNICKADDVQEELAFLMGMERLLCIFPTVLAIPYSLLADRCGRSVTLVLALFGLLLEEFWPIIVCWFSPSLNIRLVLLGPFFGVVGGGPSVIITMQYLIAADAVSEQDRSRTFLRIRTTSIAAGVAAQVTGSLLMSISPWIPWFLGILLLLAAMVTAILLPNWPKSQIDSETPILSTRPAKINSPLLPRETDLASPETNTSIVLLARFVETINSLEAGTYIVVGNGQLMLLLCAAFLAGLGEMSSGMILLLYISRRFAWDFAKANLFMAMGDSIQFIFLIVLLPYLSKVLLSHHTSAHTRDFRIAVTSMITLSIGCLLLGFAPEIWIAAMGVVLISTAGGLQAILRSLVTSSISASDISLVYSVFTILHVITNSLAGPLYSGTFTIGLNLGLSWTGLPFLVAGGLVALALTISMFVKGEQTYQQVPINDLEG